MDPPSGSLRYNLAVDEPDGVESGIQSVDAVLLEDQRHWSHRATLWVNEVPGGFVFDDVSVGIHNLHGPWPPIHYVIGSSLSFGLLIATRRHRSAPHHTHLQRQDQRAHRLAGRDRGHPSSKRGAGSWVGLTPGPLHQARARERTSVTTPLRRPVSVRSHVAMQPAAR